MFGITTFSSVPDNFITDHEAWEGYVATIWNNLLSYYDLRKNDIIIEVAPGASSKIGLALKKSEFEGTIYLIDPLKPALESISAKYKEYLPKAVIHPINMTLMESVAFLPTKANFIVANHPLDDMLLTVVSQGIASDLFECTSELHENCRSILEIDSEGPITTVINCWQQCLEMLQPKHTIICQYSSLVQKQNNIHNLNHYSKIIMSSLKCLLNTNLECHQQLQKLLNQHENFNDEYIGLEVLNASNWLVTNNGNLHFKN